MPQEPKKRHSRQRQGKRRASIRLKAKKGVACPNCKSLISPHTICKNCGYYKGKLIIIKKEKKEKPA
ncbi:MAG: 50S ribosomal protein L32 [Candidatus Levyibacteriota bacterium]